MARIVFYDGKFPFIDGVPSLISNDLFEECCCYLPESCPCEGVWPPVSWPCGGLLETYSLNSWLGIEDGPTYYRLKSPITMSAFSAEWSTRSCRWRGEGDIEYGPDGSTWYNYDTDVGFLIDLYSYGWTVKVDEFPGVGPGGVEVQKKHGQTPVGLYNDSSISSGWDVTASVS